MSNRDIGKIWKEEDFFPNGSHPGSRGLTASCQCWAKSQGFTEFASDCELSDSESFDFA